jgi:hypothetical protein
MRIYLPVAAAILTAGAFFAGTATFAQEQAPIGMTDNKKALAPEYKPLTTWDKVRIGGAYYTDPAYVSSLMFAYGFDIKEKDLSPDDRAKIAKLIKDGTVAPAIINPVTGIASTLPSTAGSGWVNGVSPGTLLLSKKDTLLGQSHSTMWVTDSADTARFTAQ